MGAQGMAQQMTAAELRALAILKRVEADELVVELGVWDGRLSEILLRHGVRLYMVDSWAPTDYRPETYVESGDPRALVSDAEMEAARLEAERRRLPYLNMATVQRCDTVTAAASHRTRSVDLVFIDADHSYEGVSRDIRAWLPIVKAGGYIGGHDFGDPSYPGVERAVREAFPDDRIETDVDRTWFVRI